jgi:hypothetical protein
VSAVDEHFFETLGLVASRGRFFTRSDASTVAVINRAAAADWWPGSEAVGKSFYDSDARRSFTVVGVVADVVQHSFGEKPRPQFYEPLGLERYGQPIVMAVRTTGNASALIQPIRRAVAAVDPDLPIGSLQTMRERLELPLWLPRTLARFFAVCAMFAVLLATVGLFGATYLSVARRTRELGVRSALGASAGTLRGLVVRDALRLVAPGVAIGIGAAAAAGVAAQSLLFGVSSLSPLTYVAAAVGQALAAVAASWLPAVWGSRVDPAVALRSD